MNRPPEKVFAAALSPFERGSEIIFGILMAISVTAAAEITSAGGLDVRELMLAALGCNLAWGLIDGVVYLLQQQFERFRNHRTFLELRAIEAEGAFRERVKEELPPVLGQVLTPDAYARVRDLVNAYAVRRPPFWSWQELATAGAICLLVFGSTFPLVVPFMVLQEPEQALQATKAVAIVMLFLLGWGLGRWSGASPFGSGALLATIGVVLAALCVALGG